MQFKLGRFQKSLQQYFNNNKQIIKYKSVLKRVMTFFDFFKFLKSLHEIKNIFFIFYSGKEKVTISTEINTTVEISKCFLRLQLSYDNFPYLILKSNFSDKELLTFTLSVFYPEKEFLFKKRIKSICMEFGQY